MFPLSMQLSVMIFSSGLNTWHQHYWFTDHRDLPITYSMTSFASHFLFYVLQTAFVIHKKKKNAGKMITRKKLSDDGNQKICHIFEMFKSHKCERLKSHFIRNTILTPLCPWRDFTRSQKHFCVILVYADMTAVQILYAACWGCKVSFLICCKIW